MKKLLIWDNPVQAIYMIMFILVCIGWGNVYSASFYTDNFSYLWKYPVFAFGSLMVMLYVRKTGYKKFLLDSYLKLIGGIVAMMLCAVFVFSSINGAHRWILLGPISLQPSEFAKLLLIMLSAKKLGVLMERRQLVSTIGGDGLIVSVCTLIIGGLVAVEPDMGTAAIIFALVFGMFIIAGVSKGQIAFYSLLGAFGAVAGVALSQFRRDRIRVWWDPFIDPTGDGYQMVQSLLAIGSGGWAGSSWGMGTGKFDYLPEAHTDFAFAVYCQEWGFVGVIILCILFTILCLAFMRITMSTRDKKGYLLAGGITFLVVGQAVANMAMVSGLLPVIGVPLTFISYGGSSMLTTMVAIGLLLSVHDEEVRQRQQDAMAPEERREELSMSGSQRRWPRNER